jgi:transposase InsO family protein
LDGADRIPAPAGATRRGQIEAPHPAGRIVAVKGDGAHAAPLERLDRIFTDHPVYGSQSRRAIHQRRVHQEMLRDHRIEISMDGRGRFHDNIFVERLWWTVKKHEWVYLRPAANGIEQKRSLGEFFDWYNLRRPHQALGWRTPDEAYLGQSTATARAA